MSGRHVAILLFLLEAAEAKLVVLDEADLLLSRFEFRPKLVAIICKQKNIKNCKTKQTSRKHVKRENQIKRC